MANRALESLKNQQGFTLIELMVVVVIMSVVVSVGVLSLGRINQDLAENQQAKIESYFKQVADQSAFNQKMYLIAPDDEGLTTYKYVNYEWQPADDIANLAWQNGFEVSWVLDEHFAEQQKLTRPGWVFWPSGDVLSGSITLKNLDTNTGSSATNREMKLSWNEALEFTRD
ncbi:prepilin-type N-terminal cleavage/methylation domain-containing protein [Thiomicrorhabdus sp.]|uniref:prepilin-type N-terminal cleavage/methylation domain-containing protein n=1 Tax=Thiomicrorhabdus sp. TaxID=2039724 RepID=UPI002AA72A07|nr:prepilin-type N-terminal cleavage/methylation domain-containing protein [Thiomicrorhabdus sp.]